MASQFVGSNEVEKDKKKAEAVTVYEKMVQAARDLETNGWAVVPNVMPEATASALLDDLWRTIEAVSKGRVKRTDPATWRGPAFFAVMKGILMEPSELYHAEPLWRVREAMADYFAYLYDDPELAVSFDRLNVFPAPGGDRKVPLTRMGPWLHTDQTPLRDGRLCVQGFFDFLGTGPNDAGLVVADKSHLQHHSLLYGKWRVKEARNWYKFTDAQRDYIYANFNVHKVTCPPRSLVLFDSRTFHQNMPPLPGGHARTIVYVCMQPWAHMGPDRAKIDAAKAKKLKAYMGQRGTSHWPLLTTLFSARARTYGKPLAEYDTSDAVIRQPSLTDPANVRIARMVGYADGPCVSDEWRSRGHVLLAMTPALMVLNKKQLLKLLDDHPRPDDAEDEDEEEEEEADITPSSKKARKE